MGRDAEEHGHRSTLFWFSAVVLCVFLWASLLTFDAGDWPSHSAFPYNDPTVNACGPLGAWIAFQLRYLLGGGVYALLLCGTIGIVTRFATGRLNHWFERVVGVALLVACTSTTAHLLPATSGASLLSGQGGLAGYALGALLMRSVDAFGAVIILAFAFFVGLLFATEGWILALPGLIHRLLQSSFDSATVFHRLRRWLPALRPTPAASTVSREESSALLDEPVRSRRGKTVVLEREPDVEEEVEAAGDEEVAEVHDVEEAEDERGSRTSKRAKSKKRLALGVNPAVARAKQALRASRDDRRPVVNFPSTARMERALAYPRQIENWTLPSLDLLHEPEFGFTDQQEVFVREQARVLEQTLDEFRVNAQVVEIDTGPVITMFELRLGPGVKVSQIATLANDIARALKVHSIRVVAPISGKNTVGIECPNVEKERVRLKELMTSGGARASKMALPLFLGKDASGQPLIADLTKMPHLLIAGTTGSGKSVCLNSIILSLLMTKRPDHVKMILIDPKMVEMTQFKDMPHLMCPLITDMQKGEKILEWAVTKMEERYELLAEARVRNVASYNALGTEELYRRLDPQSDQERAGILTFIPYVVIVIDELADLMMTSAKEVEHHLARLAQKSRAVGIHIIVATQRPEVKVVTGLIKSNLPSRICFRVASRMDSRIVLDQNGGEVLLGQGDMLMLPPGQHKLLRAQGTLLEDSEVHAVLDDLASRAKPEFHPELMLIKAPGAEGDTLLRDPLFDDAVRVVLESKRGSVSLLQRRLTIGYSRASRLIEQMSEAGIVGDYKGSQAREVLLTLDDWDSLKAQVARDLDDDYEADRDDFALTSEEDDAEPAAEDVDAAVDEVEDVEEAAEADAEYEEADDEDAEDYEEGEYEEDEEWEEDDAEEGDDEEEEETDKEPVS